MALNGFLDSAKCNFVYQNNMHKNKNFVYLLRFFRKAPWPSG